jgi:uncharacterized membrane protein
MTQPLAKSAMAKTTSTIALLAGIWLFISPWVYGSYMQVNAWNSWIVGAAIFIIGVIRLASPPMGSWVSWVNCALGIWTFFSPWIYGYSGYTGRFVNSLCVGIIVFICAIMSATASPRIAPTQPTPHRM